MTLELEDKRIDTRRGTIRLMYHAQEAAPLFAAKIPSLRDRGGQLDEDKYVEFLDKLVEIERRSLGVLRFMEVSKLFEIPYTTLYHAALGRRDVPRAKGAFPKALIEPDEEGINATNRKINIFHRDFVEWLDKKYLPGIDRKTPRRKVCKLNTIAGQSFLTGEGETVTVPECTNAFDNPRNLFCSQEHYTLYCRATGFYAANGHKAGKGKGWHGPHYRNSVGSGLHSQAVANRRRKKKTTPTVVLI